MKAQLFSPWRESQAIISTLPQHMLSPVISCCELGGEQFLKQFVGGSVKHSRHKRKAYNDGDFGLVGDVCSSGDLKCSGALTPPCGQMMTIRNPNPSVKHRSRLNMVLHSDPISVFL